MTFIYSQIFLEPLNHEDEAINSAPHPHGANMQVETGKRELKEDIRVCVTTTLEVVGRPGRGGT